MAAGRGNRGEVGIELGRHIAIVIVAFDAQGRRKVVRPGGQWWFRGCGRGVDYWRRIDEAVVYGRAPAENSIDWLFDGAIETVIVASRVVMGSRVVGKPRVRGFRKIGVNVWRGEVVAVRRVCRSRRHGVSW